MERASAANIQNWLEHINQFNATPEYGTTRILFTEEELKNREYVKGEMKKLGLEVSEDSIGNIFAVLKGTDRSLAPVWTGSHIDTVPNAGMFDGMAGVVCGMEAARMISAQGAAHKRDIVVVVYTSEEPTRFGLCCLGSRAMAGVMSLEDTKLLSDKEGTTLYDLLGRLGYDLERYQEIPKQPGEVYAAIELHIEQQSGLEKAGVPIGIVKKICAPSNFVVEVTGCQSHAGGSSMEERRDAFAASCEMALLLERLAQECQSEYNTATVGYVQVLPNAVNVIPGTVRFSIDIRDCNMDTKQKLIKELVQGLQAIAEKRGVDMQIQEECNDVPLTCNETIVECLKESCEERGIAYKDSISGPYHDSLFVGRFAPVGMIFVPSRGGISHSPEEWTDYEDLARGTEILMDTLLKLANSEGELV